MDVFKRTEGRQADALLESYRRKILNDCTFNDKTAPKIKGVVYVGFGEPSFFQSSGSVIPLKYDELHDKIFEVAYKMEVPRSEAMVALSFTSISLSCSRY